MAIEISIPQSARNMFRDGIEHVAQQLQSRFRQCATVTTGCTGKSQGHRKIQKSEMADVTGRHLDTVGDELAILQRYIFPRKAEKVTWIAEDDAQDINNEFGPTGETQVMHTGAIGRKCDDIFIAGLLGVNYEGPEDGIVTVALSTGANSQTIAVNYRRDGLTTNTGLTLAKLVRAKGRFGKQEVFGQEQKMAGVKLWCAVSQDELDNLLFEVEQTGSADYNKVKALVDGEVDYFMGINFMRTERLPNTPPSANKIIRSCPMWTSDGVHMDFWTERRTLIDVRPDKSHTIQVRSVLKMGAGRKDEDRVVNILCEQDG